MSATYRIDPYSEQVYREWEFRSGHKITNARQQRVIASLRRSGGYGVTARELAKSIGNDVSGVNTWGGAFTVLRQQDRIVALAEKREGHHVYVMPENVRGRETWGGYHHTGHCATCSCFGREEAA